MRIHEPAPEHDFSPKGERLELYKATENLKKLTRRFVEDFREELGIQKDDLEKFITQLDPNEVLAKINGILFRQFGERKKELERHEQKISTALDSLMEILGGNNTSFFQEIAGRDSELPKAIKALEKDSDAHLHFVTSVTLGGGTLGITKLVIEEIKQLMPDLRITVTVVGDNASVQDFELKGGVFKQIEARNKKERELVDLDGDSLIVGVQLNEAAFLLREPDMNFTILPNEQETFLNRNNFFGVTQNLVHPFGALPLSTTLRKAQGKKDLLTVEQIEVNRLDWLTTFVPEDFFDTLKDHAEYRKFCETLCTWSSAYFQDAESMLSEFSALGEFLRGADKDYLDSIGGRVMYFLIPGKHVYSLFTYDDLIATGATVITPKEIREPPKSERAPITILVLDSLPQEALLRLQTTLAGTTTRDSTDSFYLGWPSIVTGNGSWLECVSAGTPWVHDGYDGGIELVNFPLELFLERARAFEDKINCGIPKAEVFLAGLGESEAIYGNLEEITKRARLISEVAHRANLAHDIIRALAFKRTLFKGHAGSN